MIVAFLNRLGLLRPATAAGGDSHPAAHQLGSAAEMVTGTPRLVSPITIGMLEALGVRHALAAQYAPLLAIAAHRYHIDTTPRRAAAWLATLAHESARFTRLVENLNYSADGLAATWPARYADMAGQPSALAQSIARKPATIASLTYANRMGNGPSETGDGWIYRGRGLIQITGRDNYDRSGDALGLDLILNPERLEEPYYAAISAAEWWHRHGCNSLADTGDMAAITRRVNGGLTGLDDRLKLYSAALAYLGVTK